VVKITIQTVDQLDLIPGHHLLHRRNPLGQKLRVALPIGLVFDDERATTAVLAPAPAREKDYPDLGLEFDIPFRELGFSGTPARSSVFVMPTVNCLVELTEMPFTVVSLQDVEIINLERVGFNLKNFDMAIVFKVGLHALST
jgi:hypothetical protein